MQIFLISKSRKKSQTLTLGPVALCVCLILSVVIGLFIFHAGSIHALNLTRGSFKDLYSQTAPIWSQEIDLQQQMLDSAQENAEKNLDALAARLSKLQSHVMRLDALGSRLADMADLNEIEFWRGRILANVWHEDVLLVIHPQTGVVEKEYSMFRVVTHHVVESILTLLKLG